jgi:AraC-like DNA-binding protein
MPESLMISAAPRLVLDQTFTDLWNFCEAIGWDIEFRQLDAGHLDARATVIAGEGVQIVKFDLNRGFHQLGVGPEGMLTFGILDVHIPQITWCSKDMPGGTLANFNLESGFDCVSGAGFAGYGLLLNPDLLQKLAEQSSISDSMQSIAVGKVNWNSPGTAALGKKLKAICSDAVNLGGDAVKEHAEFVNEEIGFALLSELTRDTKHTTVVTPAHRHKILKKALEILNDPEELPITVARLCERVGTSPATLHRIFLSEYGVPPKVYIRSRSLSAVRDALAHSFPGNRVSDVANRWGFWHMGQFAHDYRQLFGELPSETLRRGH